MGDAFEPDDEYWNEIAAEIDVEIADEEGLWQAQRVSMQMIQVNAYLLQMKVEALLEAINELGISKSQMNAIFKRNVLKQLQSDRAMVLEERNRANSEIAIAKKNLLGPDGRPVSL